MLSKDFVERYDRHIHMLPFKNVGWQKTQNCIAGAIDDDVTLQHVCHYLFSKVR